MRTKFVVASIIVLALIFWLQLFFSAVLWSLVLVIPLIAVGLYDMFQHVHSVLRHFPLIGRGRWLMEFIRPYVRQYLIESDTDGTPINRMFRSIVYQRAKGDRETVPFGTRVDTYRSGYEWVNHSSSPNAVIERDPRIRFGGSDCQKPYGATTLYFCAMCFCPLSIFVISALNKGGHTGGSCHNRARTGNYTYCVSRRG